MTPRRNDPCPCGSGRKYKHCCMEKDEEARLASRPLLGIDDEAWGQAADAPSWDADIVTLGIHVEDRPGSRQVAVIVAGGGLVLDTEMIVDPSPEPEDVADLLETALRRAAVTVGTWPDRVVVRHPEVADILAGRLVVPGVEIMHQYDLVDFDHAAASLRAHFGDDRPVQVGTPPDSMRSWGPGDDWLRDYFAASAAFLRKAPWKRLDDDQSLLLDAPSGRTWLAAIHATEVSGGRLGAGLSLCSSTYDFLILAAAGQRPEVPQFQGRCMGMNFDAGEHVPPLRRREVEEADWEVAADDGWPYLWTINMPAGGLDTKDAGDLLAALRSIPDAVEALQTSLRARREGAWEDPASRVLVRYDPDPPYLQEILEDGERKEMGRAYQAMHRGIQDRIDREQPDGLQAVQRITNEEIERYNRTPQKELGGLDPTRLMLLLGARWDDPDGPVRLHTDLHPEAFAGSADLRNTRTLLRAVDVEGGLKATATGNLPRALVNRLRDELDFGGQWPFILDRDYHFRSEEDFIPLWHLRRLLEFAGLLERHRSKWVVTGRGRELLAESEAGRLLHHLLDAQFYRLNLAALDGFPECPEFQDGFFYSLYRLHRLDDTWREAAEMTDLLILPTMRSDVEEAFKDADQLIRAFSHRILDRLAQAGLAERLIEDDAFGFPRAKGYRPAPLLKQFVSFPED